MPLFHITKLKGLRDELCSKWYQFGIAVGMSEEQLSDLLVYDPEVCLQKVLRFWKENTSSRLAWGNLAALSKHIKLQSFPESTS